MTDEAPAPSTRRKVLEAMRAVLSDDDNYERGLAAVDVAEVCFAD